MGQLKTSNYRGKFWECSLKLGCEEVTKHWVDANNEGASKDKSVFFKAGGGERRNIVRSSDKFWQKFATCYLKWQEKLVAPSSRSHEQRSSSESKQYYSHKLISDSALKVKPSPSAITHSRYLKEKLWLKIVKHLEISWPLPIQSKQDFFHSRPLELDWAHF